MKAVGYFATMGVAWRALVVKVRSGYTKKCSSFEIFSMEIVIE